MASVSFTHGSVTLELGPELEEAVKRAIDHIVPGARDAMEREVDNIIAEARRTWPVDTGRSRDGLASELRISGDGTLRAIVRNTVDYAIYVKSRRLPASGSAVVELLRKPLRISADRLAVELGPAIKRLVEG